jgi:hypothetical protein
VSTGIGPVTKKLTCVSTTFTAAIALLFAASTSIKTIEIPPEELQQRIRAGEIIT